MKQIPTPDPFLSTTPDTQQREASDADQHGWLPDLLRRQARRDAPADDGFAVAMMQMLPSRTGPAAAARRDNGIPSWLAAALPWFGLYGLAVAAAMLLWLALTLMPAAPALLASGALGAKEELVGLLGTALERWLAPVLILGWLAWWLQQQEWLVE